MKVKTIVLVVSVVFIIVAGFTAIKVFSPPDINDFPTLMDASGSVSLTEGDFKLDKQPLLGDPSAPVTMVEFIDYKCPSCANWALNGMSELKKEFIDTGKVKLYIVNFPFLGPDSILAAMAAESVAAQSPELFYEFNEKLYAHQGQEKIVWATEKFLLDFVKKNVKGVDYKKFKTDMKNRTYLFNVKEDFKISSKNRVEGTPYFYINNKSFYGNNYQAISSMINAELKK